MAHVYEVTARDGSTREAHVDDEHHHEKLQNAALFFTILASASGLAKDAIKAAKWLRTYAGKAKVKP